ncbi:MAG: hypothetical protein EA361_03990 [Bacteroidetes bacterium]|nr:MAG: hypothetical protein EA361_03990 [Bacteroidota bacterium]
MEVSGFLSVILQVFPGKLTGIDRNGISFHLNTLNALSLVVPHFCRRDVEVAAKLNPGNLTG